MARAQPLIPLVCDLNRWIGGKGWSWRVDGEGGRGGGRGGGGRGEKRLHLSPTLNDSLGQPLPHMLSGEREARMLTQTNRWRGGKGGIKRGKIDRDGGILNLSN